MLTRIFFISLFVFGVTGCATTQNKTSQDQVQTRVVELEKKLEEKDSEIVDLQYEVKDLSSRVDATKTSPSAQAEQSAETVAVSKGGNDFIRVAVAPEKIQSALKAAGFYNGKVDGKVGSATKMAIMQFQKSKGLVADGIVGRKTWEALSFYMK